MKSFVLSSIIFFISFGQIKYLYFKKIKIAKVDIHKTNFVSTLELLDFYEDNLKKIFSSQIKSAKLKSIQPLYILVNKMFILKKGKSIKVRRLFSLELMYTLKISYPNKNTNLKLLSDFCDKSLLIKIKNKDSIDVTINYVLSKSNEDFKPLILELK